MYQYYIFELQTLKDGEFNDVRHIASDEDANIARQKAESKFHEVMAIAAISDLPCHAVAMVTSEGAPVMHGCYKH